MSSYLTRLYNLMFDDEDEPPPLVAGKGELPKLTPSRSNGVEPPEERMRDFEEEKHEEDEKWEGWKAYQKKTEWEEGLMKLQEMEVEDPNLENELEGLEQQEEEAQFEELFGGGTSF